MARSVFEIRQQDEDGIAEQDERRVEPPARTGPEADAESGDRGAAPSRREPRYVDGELLGTGGG